MSSGELSTPYTSTREEAQEAVSRKLLEGLQYSSMRLPGVETRLGSILAGTLDELATNRWRRDFAQRTTDCCFLGFFSFIDSLDYMVG